MVTYLTLLAALGLVIWFAWKLLKGHRTMYGSATYDCFTSAAKVFAFTGSDDALLAVMAITKAVDEEYRLRLLSWVHRARGVCMAFAERDETCREGVSRLSRLIEMMASQNWTREDALEAMNELDTANPEYASALRAFDASIFVRRLPEISVERVWHHLDSL